MGCLINPRYVVRQHEGLWGIHDTTPPVENRNNFAVFGASEYGRQSSQEYADRLNQGRNEYLDWDDEDFG